MKFLSRIFVGLLTLAILFGIGYYAITNFTNPIDLTKDAVVDALDVEEETVHTSEIISDGFKDMGELITYEYFYTQVDNEETIRSINGVNLPFTKSKYTISYDGTIDAGINFADILVEEDEDTGKITITIPDAIITSNEVDTSTFEVYDENSNIFNPIKVTDINESIDDIKASALEKAKEKGILEKAKENAKALVENFVSSIVDPNETTVVYK